MARIPRGPRALSHIAFLLVAMRSFHPAPLSPVLQGLDSTNTPDSFTRLVTPLSLNQGLFSGGAAGERHNPSTCRKGGHGYQWSNLDRVNGHTASETGQHHSTPAPAAVLWTMYVL
ncbi:uncharacterized protein BO97DRAFT_123574 [Aspergillus homomorphus CBS 101889]|uniref:Secreted protein n=1 Tax=Aspergillus homomorphus (strain CBS 101889) TaxID=1450537 RepID=A0A395HS24_ASPHC|nr:hypothetical protein BO97DRAFT_123574 [Aspergillus homomorphus CBS 101889]RAL10617.1 hypothetical protein BO97DRAFT_123574 [Aspergillus homomorphus CBS 101889]